MTARSFLSSLLLLLCAVAAWWHFSNHPEALRPLRSISGAQLIALLGLHGALIAINTVRFRLILHKCAERHIPFGPWTLLFVHGRFLNTFVPQLGNVYRSVALKQQFAVSYTRYITTLIAVGWLSTTLNIWIAWLLIVVQHPTLQLGGVNAVFLIAVVAVLITTGPFLTRTLFRLFLPRSQRRIPIKITEVLSVTTLMIRDIPWLSKVLSLSVLVFVVAAINIHLCFAMVNTTPLYGETALFYTLLQLSNLIKLTPGNLGPQELAFGFLGAQSTVGLSEGILASAIFRTGAVTMLCCCSALLLPFRSVSK